MGRPKETIEAPVPLLGIRPEIAEAIVEGQRTELTSAEKEDLFALGASVGRAEAFDLIGRASDSFALLAFDDAKKSKAWKVIRNKKTGEAFQSFDEFCGVMWGRSYRRLQELSANRKAVGFEAYKKAEEMSLRQVDYNSIKALPEPDRVLISRALQEDQTRDDVLNLLQELAARHAKEKEAFNKELDLAKKELLATEERLRVVNGRREIAEQEAARIAVLEPDASLEDLKIKATRHMHGTCGYVKGNLRQAIKAIVEQFKEHDNGLFLAGLVGQVQAELNEVRDEFLLPDFSNARDLELAAETAKWYKPSAPV
ncbi:MAG: hypothetical protein ACYC4S_09670 [Rhodoferax sp.]